jgi:hypothetical protein
VDPQPNNFIDELAFAKFRRIRVNPSDICDDTTFFGASTLTCSG